MPLVATRQLHGLTLCEARATDKANKYCTLLCNELGYGLRCITRETEQALKGIYRNVVGTGGLELDPRIERHKTHVWKIEKPSRG